MKSCPHTSGASGRGHGAGECVAGLRHVENWEITSIVVTFDPRPLTDGQRR